MQVVQAICRLLYERELKSPVLPHAKLNRFVADRPGHDRRYAIDAGKIRQELDWVPRMAFENGLRATVDWYLAHRTWVEQVTSGEYRQWVELNYRDRVV